MFSRGAPDLSQGDFNPLAALSFLAPYIKGVPIAQSKFASQMARASGLAVANEDEVNAHAA